MVVNFILSYYILFVLCCIIRNRIASDNDYHMLLSKESTGRIKGSGDFCRCNFSYLSRCSRTEKSTNRWEIHVYYFIFRGWDWCCYFFPSVGVWVLYLYRKNTKRIYMVFEACIENAYLFCCNICTCTIIQ